MTSLMDFPQDAVTSHLLQTKEEDKSENEFARCSPCRSNKNNIIRASTTTMTTESDDVALTTFHFYLDLVQESQNHVRFLRKLHANDTSLQRPSPRSLHRYVHCWLPLVAKLQKQRKEQEQQELLIPPSDVAWLWHCHRLAPMHYERYVRGRFGQEVMLEANPPFSCQDFHDDEIILGGNERCYGSGDDNMRSSSGKAAVVSTKRIWREMFPAEPFFLEEQRHDDTDAPCSSKDRIKYKEEEFDGKVGGFDLVSSTQRQKDFLYQISGCHYQNVDFLKDGVNKYYQFLRLKPTTPESSSSLPLVPTFQIDLMWHTHILVSLQMYNKECLAIRGERFHHDDNMDDRTPGAILDLAFQHTAQLWKETYGEDYAVCGAMYRGESPASYYDCHWQPSLSVTTENKELTCIMAGSNSSGTTGTGWKVPGVDPDCFIPARPKSRRRGVNSNPQRTGYVFGATSSAGAGYYSLETREAYELLSKQLRSKAGRKLYDSYGFECDKWLCCFCLSSREKSREKKAREALWEEVEDIYDMVAQVEARHNAAGPYEVVDPAVVAAHYKRLFGDRKSTRRNNHQQDENNKSKSTDATGDQNYNNAAAAAYYLDSGGDTTHSNHNQWTSHVVNAAGGCGGIAMAG
jgi:Glycine-rich domain-containing protein-like